jgi:hypothetical protein
MSRYKRILSRMYSCLAGLDSLDSSSRQAYRRDSYTSLGIFCDHQTRQQRVVFTLCLYAPRTVRYQSHSQRYQSHTIRLSKFVKLGKSCSGVVS